MRLDSHPSSESVRRGVTVDEFFDRLLTDEVVFEGGGGTGSNASPPPPSANSTPTAAIPLKRGVNYVHDQMIDLIIATPGITQNAIAEATGYSVSWVSQIMNADAFKVRLAARREALVDPEIRESVERSFDGLIKRSQDILRDKLSQPSHQVPDQLVLRTLELSSRARGYGAKVNEPPPPGPPLEVHLNVIGERLIELNRRARLTLEHENGEVQEANPRRPAAADRVGSDQPAEAAGDAGTAAH